MKNRQNYREFYQTNVVAQNNNNANNNNNDDQNEKNNQKYDGRIYERWCDNNRRGGF